MTYWRLFYHVIWGTRNRMPIIDANREAILVKLLPGIAREHDVLTHAVGMMPDHIHMVISVPPKVAIANVVNKLKGSSSHFLSHDQSALPHESWIGWQPEYGVLSFAERDLQSVVRYVVNQKEHYRSQQLNQRMERFFDFEPNRERLG